LIGLAVLFGLYQYVALRLASDVIAWPRRPKAPPPDSTQYDRYTVGYLVGGAPRVAAVAMAGLVPARVRVDRKGHLSVTDDAYLSRSFGSVLQDGLRSAALERVRAVERAPTDTTESAGSEQPRPTAESHADVSDLTGLESARAAEANHDDTFESAALARISREGGRGTLATVNGTFAQLSDVDAIRDRLIDDGLLVKPYDSMRRVWVAVVFGAVLLLGVIRLVAGLDNGHPVGGLVLEMLLAGTIGLVILGSLADRAVPTRSGKALTAELKDRYTGVAGSGAVAVLGLTALGDPELSKYLLKGGVDHSGGGSGCGGGGGCGGGCGG
jgi:uncharacterized protein (TIGR04222 family)